MNSEKRDSGLFPFGLPLFVVVVGATLVYSSATTLLRLNTTAAPMFAIGLASAILLLASLAAVVGEEEAFYIKLLGTIVALVVVGLGIMNAAAGHHTEQAGIIIIGVVLSGVLAFTLAPRSVPLFEDAEREKLPARPVIGAVVMVAAVAGLVVYSQWQTSKDEVSATPSPTANATAAAVASATTGPGTGGTVIAIAAGDNFFDPAEVSAAAGSAVTFEVTNSGVAPHNFAITGGPKIDLIAAGQKMTLDFTMPASGEVQFVCDFHPPGMVGVIKVQ